MPSRDIDIGRPKPEGLLLEKISLSLQILTDETIEDKDLGEPEEEKK